MGQPGWQCYGSQLLVIDLDLQHSTDLKGL